MEKFTRIEIEWVAGFLEREAENLRSGGITDAFSKLQLEKYESLANKFRKVLDMNSKRIEVKY